MRDCYALRKIVDVSLLYKKDENILKIIRKLVSGDYLHQNFAEDFIPKLIERLAYNNSKHSVKKAIGLVPESKTHLLFEIREVLENRNKKPVQQPDGQDVTTRHRMINDLHDKASKMLNKETSYNERELNKIIKNMFELNDYTTPLKIAREIVSSKKIISVLVFTTLINCFIKKNRLKSAQEVSRMVLSNGAEPDAQTWYVIVSLFVNAKNVSESFRLLNRMRRKGHSPDVRIYSIIMNGCIDVGDFDRAKRIHELMIEDGIAMDDNSRRVVVRMYLKDGDLNKAFEFVLDATKGSDAYIALINYCFELGCMDKIRDIIQMMNRNKVQPGIHVYNLLLGEYSRANLHVEANEVFQLLRECGLTIDTDAWSHELSNLVNIGHVDKALAIITDVNKNDPRSSTPLFITTIDECIKTNNIDKAQMAYRILLNSEVEFDRSELMALTKLQINKK
ncbi:hypothetical protein AKO1_008759 [Acrasis kona]|uniref:PROP1-like PPR domain-containing protein n=1 Tax=Acrasis kona TaxID=1008807 RepID=A0AAW2ZGL6_9EUKA